MRGRSLLALLLILAALVGVGCCSTAGYYAQAGWGGVRLLAARRPIARVMADPETPHELKRQLEIARQAREFAIHELRLPDNGSYRHYAELDRPYASWVVTAAPELSLTPVEWCFPVAGCVTYRGYFSPRRAERFARRLQRRQLDVDVSGVQAFSTLGWFADPVLSTFVYQTPASLAGLLFHELAHQRLYVKGDTGFNESFATFVELEGVRRWLAASGRQADRAAFEAGKRRQRQLTELLAAFRTRLGELYAGPEPDDLKRARKTEIFGELAAAITALRISWGVEPGAAASDGAEWNNADLVAIAAYWSLVPAFDTLLAGAQGDLESFYAAVDELAELDPGTRQARLDELAAGRSPP